MATLFVILMNLLYMASVIVVGGLLLGGIYALIFESVLIGLAMIGGAWVSFYVLSIIIGLLQAGAMHVVHRSMLKGEEYND